MLGIEVTPNNVLFSEFCGLNVYKCKNGIKMQFEIYSFFFIAFREMGREKEKY